MSTEKATTAKKAPAKKAPARKPTTPKAATPKAAAATEVEADAPFAELPLADVVKHPRNPRHRAVADAEMVASIKAQGVLQPLTVAPHPDEPGKWILIAGHRRHDGAKKARLAVVPAYLRRDLDTEAKQVEAMLVENVHRADLSPIEEAEGYQQLSLLGHTQKAIAEKVGRDVGTVRARLKLLKLQPSTRKKVHAGQLTLEDAAAVTEFADDRAATKRLERAAADGYNLRSQIQRERRRASAERTVAETEAALLEAGAREHQLQEGERTWSMKSATVIAGSNLSREWADHDGCLGYVKTPGSNEYDPAIYIVCLDHEKHAGQIAAGRDAAQQRAAEARREQEQADAAAAAAADVRMRSLLDLVGTSTRLPDAVQDLVRVLLPQLIADLDGTAQQRFFDAMAVPAEDRWEHCGGYHDGRDEPRLRGFLLRQRQYCDAIATWTPGTLTRALVAALAAQADENLTATYDQRLREAHRYVELLREAGHPFGDVDAAIAADVDERYAKRGDRPLSEAIVTVTEPVS